MSDLVKPRRGSPCCDTRLTYWVFVVYCCVVYILCKILCNSKENAKKNVQDSLFSKKVDKNKHTLKENTSNVKHITMPTFRFIAVAVLALATLVTSQESWGDGSPRSNGFSSNYRQDNSDVVRRYNHEVRTRNYPRI